MARIQKKKASDIKRKKTGEEGASQPVSGRDESARADSAPETVASADAERKRKKLYAPPKRFGQEQTAMARLVDRYFGSWIQFLREVKIELSKVAWPSRKQTIASTAIVIVFVFLIALFLGVVDVTLSSLIRLVI